MYRDFKNDFYKNILPTQKNTFILNEELFFMDERVPKGFETNGADTPKLFWWFFPPFKPKFLPAVILHDFLIKNALSQSNKNKKIKLIKRANERFESLLLLLEDSLKNKVTIFCLKVYWKGRILCLK